MNTKMEDCLLVALTRRVDKKLNNKHSMQQRNILIDNTMAIMKEFKPKSREEELLWEAFRVACDDFNN